MKDKKLISMVEFVIEQYINYSSEGEECEITHTQYLDRTIMYAEFLQKPLTLGMFVPTDEDGNVLEEPNRDDERYFGDWGLSNWSKDNHQYQQAKERVLFEGFTCVNDIPRVFIGGINNGFTIDKMIYAGLNNTTLTQTGRKIAGYGSI